MIKNVLLGSFLLFSATSFSQKASVAADSKMNSFINSLMQKMTLEEKIGQMNLPTVERSLFV